MKKLLNTTLAIIWALDICNMPFMEALDTKYPVNALAWTLMWVAVTVVWANGGKAE